MALWQDYRKAGSRTWWLLPLSLLATAGIEVHILASYPSWAKWLTPLVLVGCIVATIGLILGRILPLRNVRLSLVATTLAVLALMVPATTFAAYTMQHTETGNIVRAGPSTNGTGNGPGGFGGFEGNGGPGRFPGAGATSGQSSSSSRPAGGFGTPPGNSPSAETGTSTTRPAGAGNGTPGMHGAGGPGGDVSSAVIKYLEAHRGNATYVAATTNSQSAAPIIIATGQPVMSLGGFSGSDPILTIQQLATLAREGVVRYFLVGGGGPQDNNTLTTWIQQHSRVISVGGTQLYEYRG